MSVTSVVASVYQNVNGINSTSAKPIVSTAGDSTATSQTVAKANANSSLSAAIVQSLSQMNGGAPSLLTSQQSSSDLTSSLLAAIQGTSSSNTSSTNSLTNLFGYSSGQTTTPVKLDQSSSTINLQASIQSLISQLDGSSGTSSLLGGDSVANTPAGLGDLQQSFNNLVTASGGNPTQASLQSFLKTVAVNLQGSMSIGSLFDTSA